MTDHGKDPLADPATADYVMDLFLDSYMSDRAPDEEISDLEMWAWDVLSEAQIRSFDDVLAAWFARLQRESDPAVRQRIVDGPIVDALDSRRAIGVTLAAARRSSEVRTVLRSLDLPWIHLPRWSELAELLATTT